MDTDMEPIPIAGGEVAAVDESAYLGSISVKWHTFTLSYLNTKALLPHRSIDTSNKTSYENCKHV